MTRKDIDEVHTMDGGFVSVLKPDLRAGSNSGGAPAPLSVGAQPFLPNFAAAPDSAAMARGGVGYEHTMWGRGDQMPNHDAPPNRRFDAPSLVDQSTAFSAPTQSANFHTQPYANQHSAPTQTANYHAQPYANQHSAYTQSASYHGQPHANQYGAPSQSTSYHTQPHTNQHSAHVPSAIGYQASQPVGHHAPISYNAHAPSANRYDAPNSSVGRFDASAIHPASANAQVRPAAVAITTPQHPSPMLQSATPLAVPELPSASAPSSSPALYSTYANSARGVVTVAASVLDCTMCFELFNLETRIPRLLACGHYFCSQCMQNMADDAMSMHGIECLICAHVSPHVKGRKVEKMPKNLAIIAMLESMGCASTAAPAVRSMGGGVGGVGANSSATVAARDTVDAPGSVASWAARVETWLERIHATFTMIGERMSEIKSEEARTATHIAASFERTKEVLVGALDKRRDQVLAQLAAASAEKKALLERQLGKWSTQLELATSMERRLREVADVAHADAGDPGQTSSHALAALIRELQRLPLPSSSSSQSPSSSSSSSAGDAAAQALEAPLVASAFKFELISTPATALISGLGTVSSVSLSIHGQHVRDDDMDCVSNVAFTPDGQFYVGFSFKLVDGKQQVHVRRTADHSIAYTFCHAAFKRPVRVAVSNDGIVVVADRAAHSLFLFRLDGTFLCQLGSQGASLGRYSEPCGVHVSKSGLVFIADSGNHRIQVLRLVDGSFVRLLGSPVKGVLDGQFNTPAAVCLSTDETEIYVCDSGNHRVQVFDLNGRFLRKWGEQGVLDGQLNCPEDVCYAPSGEVLVCDKDNHRVQVFTPHGLFLRSFGAMGSVGPGRFQHPFAMALAPSGHLYVKSTGRQGRFSVLT